LITEDGQVKNLATNAFLTPIQNPNGYLKVGLADGQGGHTQISIHRLVALHYLPNPYEYSQINHKDGNKENNHKDNLEWCSQQMNNQHALETGLRPGYMSADDKEKYLQEILNGVQVNDLAQRIKRGPETLHKMLRETAERLGIHDQWKRVMKENRRNAALRNLEKINT
jgi:hypothetical protein